MDIRKDAGFTLIELLVTVAIIGILAATAISEFGAYKKRSFDVKATSALRNAISAQEAYFTDNESYADSQASLPGFPNIDSKITLDLSASEDSWSGSAFHEDGQKTSCYSNNSAFSLSGVLFDVAGLGSSCGLGSL